VRVIGGRGDNLSEWPRKGARLVVREACVYTRICGRQRARGGGGAGCHEHRARRLRVPQSIAHATGQLVVHLRTSMPPGSFACAPRRHRDLAFVGHRPPQLQPQLLPRTPHAVTRHRWPPRHGGFRPHVLQRPSCTAPWDPSPAIAPRSSLRAAVAQCSQSALSMASASLPTPSARRHCRCRGSLPASPSRAHISPARVRAHVLEMVVAIPRQPRPTPRRRTTAPPRSAPTPSGAPRLRPTRARDGGAFAHDRSDAIDRRASNPGPARTASERAKASRRRHHTRSHVLTHVLTRCQCASERWRRRGRRCRGRLAGAAPHRAVPQPQRSHTNHARM